MKEHPDHDLVLVKANSSAARVKRASRARPEPKPPVVRFWIITMLLVLFGLSTLKLR